MSDVSFKVKENPDIQQEHRLLTAMVVSDKFLKDIQTIYNPNLFDNPIIALVGSWCIDYFNKYGKAPNSHLKDIFDDSVGGILKDDTSIEFVRKVLVKLSSDYENGSSINDEYLLDKAEVYFKKKSLVHLSDRIKHHALSTEVTKGRSHAHVVAHI